MIRLRPSGVDEVLIKRVRDWYEPGPGVFFTGITGSVTPSFSPAMLFTAGVNGAWYDPSDLTTLFQDAAGTTPVTAVEQPVGLMLDKSGRGNHAFNNSGNSANFPVLSARYNLLTKTEQFNDTGVWSPYRASVSANTSETTDPLGGNSADKILESIDTNTHGISASISTSGTVTVSIYAKAAERSFLYLDTNTANTRTFFNLSTGVKGTVGSAVTADMVPVGDNWYRCSITGALSGDIYIGPATANNTYYYQGDITKGIYIWGASLVFADQATLPYQRVNTPSDYDTVGFKQAEVFDGINDYLLASAGGGSTTAFFWCSAIRVGKVGAAQTLFSDAGTNTGYVVRVNASNQLELSAGNGTAYTTIATTATLAVGQRVVLTAWHDGTNLNVQINNGTVQQAAFVTATAGTAQFTIGKDNNAATNFFSGRLYEKVYTKDNVPSAAQIASTKSYVANIAGITL